MGRRPKEIVYPHLNDCKGDVTGKWYVEFSVTSKVIGEKIRQRIYEGFDQHTTYYDKKIYAEKLIQEYTDKLNSGWRPDECDPVEFEDKLAYCNAIAFSGRKSRKKSYIQPLFSEYLDWKEPYVADTTLEDHRSKLRVFSQYLESNNLLGKDLTAINNSVVVDFLRILAKKYAQRTIDKYKQVLFSFFNFLRKEKKIKIQNPLDDSIPRMGKIVDMAPAGIPESIRIKLKDAIEKEDPQLWMACCFVYYTAIRPCTELRYMQLKQINFESQTVTVFNSRAKTRKTETIDIPDELFYLITQKWKLQDYPGDLYLLSSGGMPGTHVLGRNTMRERFNKVRDDLKLSKDIKYYSWKHSGAQELADAGANTYELQRHLRHRELASTEAYLRKRIGQRSDRIKHEFPSIG
ncbi:MAG: tyrosine-type recombinase/integrase [Dysgonamonadaceae bacterium]|nr:tyrosine-type recombinase/integrase [Dysgonamonadaceae bacterium]